MTAIEEFGNNMDAVIGKACEGKVPLEIIIAKLSMSQHELNAAYIDLRNRQFAQHMAENAKPKTVAPGQN